jgi:hypothetical protein
MDVLLSEPSSLPGAEDNFMESIGGHLVKVALH